MDSLCREIRLAPSFFGKSSVPLRTIYLGGGTPSLLSSEEVQKILAVLSDTFGIAEDCEITLEANPGTVDGEKLRAFREMGVNRLSIGIQSLSDPVLQVLGRIHNAEGARRTIMAAQEAGFTNLSSDMMLGIPGQSLQDVEGTLAFFLERNIPHVSLYSLILEEGTPMYSKYQGDIEKYVSQEEDRAMYHYVVDTLKKAGFLHYEISNMARPGFESRHNTMYWRAEPYYAFGLGAHYYLGEERGTHRAGSIDEYIEAFRKNTVTRETIYETEEILTEEERRKEFMMLGFRTGDGVDADRFQERFGISMESAFAKELEREVKTGLVMKEGRRYHLTEKGFDLANQVFEDYV